MPGTLKNMLPLENHVQVPGILVKVYIKQTTKCMRSAMIKVMNMNDPARYRQEFKDVGNTLVTRSGATLQTRLIQPDDADLLIDLAHKLTPETRRRRFHQSMEHLSEQMAMDYARRLADVDNQTLGGAILALTEDANGKPHVVAVARLGRAPDKPDDPVAEAAIVVRDDYQGEGVGTELLRRLVLLARQMKVRQIVAMIESDNSHAIRLFNELGLPTERASSYGETTLTIDIPDY